MLWKCCIQYASKFGKLSSGHRTEKGQFSFQPQRKVMTKNVQTIAYLQNNAQNSPSQASQWTVNFQMLKLYLEKAEEWEMKLSTSVGSSKKQENSRKICFCFIDYAKAFDCVDHNKL